MSIWSLERIILKICQMSCSLRLSVNIFRKKGQLNPEQLECEKAFLMCRPQDGWNGIPPAGLGRIHELLMNNKTKKILEDDYNLGIKDYYKLLGNHLYNDSILQTKSRNMQEENKYLIEKKE